MSNKPLTAAETDGLPIDDLEPKHQKRGSALVAFLTLFLRRRGSVDKYSFQGRKKAVETFTTRQGLRILVAVGGILGGLLLLWMLGYLQP